MNNNYVQNYTPTNYNSKNIISSDISSKSLNPSISNEKIFGGDIFNNNYENNINENYYDDSIVFTIMTAIIGILLGVVIGYFIFRDIKYIGPDSNQIVKKTYKDDKGRLYKYKPIITICPVNYSMNKLHDSKFKEKH
jgi:hypothetical protein